jgi:hypothetical protein
MKKQKNQAAAELGRLSRINPTPAQSDASRLNGKKGGRPPGSWVGNTFYPRPVVMLHRADGEWWLATWKHGEIPAKSFPTAQAARDFAASKNWGVKRLPECDR